MLFTRKITFLLTLISLSRSLVLLTISSVDIRSTSSPKDSWTFQVNEKVQTFFKTAIPMIGVCHFKCFLEEVGEHDVIKLFFSSTSLICRHREMLPKSKSWKNYVDLVYIDSLSLRMPGRFSSKQKKKLWPFLAKCQTFNANLPCLLIFMNIRSCKILLV